MLGRLARERFQIIPQSKLSRFRATVHTGGPAIARLGSLSHFQFSLKQLFAVYPTLVLVYNLYLLDIFGLIVDKAFITLSC